MAQAGKTVFRKDYTPPSYVIDHTHLHINLHATKTRVKARLDMRRNPDAKPEQTDITLNGAHLNLQSIALNGQPLSKNQYRLEAETLTLLNPPATFTLETEVEINPAANTALEGLYQDSGGMLCTQCEAEGFRRITYFLDRPDVLSRYTVTLEAEKADYPVLLCNGNPIASQDMGSRHQVTWKDPFPKPSYLFALVAGQLDYLEDTFTTLSGRKIMLRLFTETHNMHKTRYAMDALKRAMAWDEKVFGREYDLDIFMIVAVDAFNMGAMENKGLNIFNASAVLASPDTTTDMGFVRIEAIVAHEYFHNWSGNRVTCRSWFELSLKEGFTVFRDQQFTADMHDAAVKRIEDVRMLRAEQFPEDASGMAHPIRPDSYQEINNFYTRTVYEKGAEIIRMQHTLLGAAKFRQATDLYFSRHDGQAVTCEDFVRAMEDASGLDLKQFRNWYSQAGTPVVEGQGSYDPAARTFTLRLKQNCPPSPGQPEKLPFHIPIKMGLVGKSGKDIPLKASDCPAGYDTATQVLHLTKPEQTFVFKEISETPIPSLLRGFSAPVKLKYPYSMAELLFLMRHDSDGFSRWEAAQTLMVRVLEEQMDAFRAKKPLTVEPQLLQAAQDVLSAALDGTLTPALAAETLALPPEGYLAELHEHIDLDAIEHARTTVRKAMANHLAPLCRKAITTLVEQAPYAAEVAQIGRRRLKNMCLDMLCLIGDAEALATAHNQLKSATNMTDQAAALRCMVEYAPLDSRKGAIEDFYQQWQDDPLVLDLWFSLQAGSTRENTLPHVQELLKHKAFSFKRPNSVRAVVGAFSQSGVKNFHNPDGSGYRLYADQVLAVDALNPQIAARLSAPFGRWKRFDNQRQALLKAEISRILENKSLSRNTAEILSKTLG